MVAPRRRHQRRVEVEIVSAFLVAAAAFCAGRRATVSDEARADLAEEEAALRRVATMVAHQAPAAEIFARVAEEVARLPGVGAARIQRYEPGGETTVVAGRGDQGAAGAGSPIVVDGRVWGTMIAGSHEPAPLPAGTERRVREFTGLVAAAISNLQARSDLAASRARVVAAADAERRRVVRDLHDGAQQRLVHTVVTLKLARRALQVAQDDHVETLVGEALDQAERASVEVRELAHGILPAVLAHGGLRAGVDALASRTPVPVENAVAVDRLPEAVEATAYFVVAEALTNVAKHAGAARVTVTAHVEQDALRIDVRDDGIGGARVDGGGLLRLGDRLAVLDGRLRVESPADGGTRVVATIPIPAGHALTPVAR